METAALSLWYPGPDACAFALASLGAWMPVIAVDAGTTVRVIEGAIDIDRMFIARGSIPYVTCDVKVGS